MGDRLIGIGEASRLLGLSTSRVRQLVDQGLLSAELTDGGHRRFRPDLLRRESLELRRGSGAAPEWATEFPLAGLAEDVVWAQIRSELGEIPEPAKRILGYAITEMANNAIDHSHGTTLRATVSRDGRNVRAVTALEANGFRFVVDNRVPDIALGQGLTMGTTVTMTLDLDTGRKLVDIFAAHTEDGEFVRTTPRIELVQHGSEFLSRSQAKRFAAGLEEFEHVILDFTGVDLVGQGFADELFRVWQAEHPAVRFEVAGANPGVELMIGRVTKP